MELPAGPYKIIYADCPWWYHGQHSYQPHGHASIHYPCMKDEELMQMPVKDITDKNSVLFLWVTSPLLARAMPIIPAWGFRYKSSFVWDKILHNMGYYNSVRHEFLLIATKGSCVPPIRKLFDSVQSIPREKRHSKKPEIFRNIIDTLYPEGKRLELFARSQTSGWDVWGNEV